MPPRLLLVDPDPTASAQAAAALESEELEIVWEPRAEGASERLEREAWDLLLADRGAGGDRLLARAGELADPPAVILSDAFGSIRDAVEAIRRGAVDYLAKPTADEQLLLAVRHALERRALFDENRRLRARLGERFELGSLVTRDPRMGEVLATLEAVADTAVNLLVEGESGTGKTALAQAIHGRSSRAAGPFVEVNCGALPESLLESELFGHVRGAFTGAVRDRAGKFEAADGGTLFLDEIATASPDLQVKLLRVLEDRRLTRVGDSRPVDVDVRVIAATNRPLAGEVDEGRFREDLYYRIHVVSVELPPLRERPADVPLLAELFLDRYRDEHGRPDLALGDDARRVLLACPWPGNVRQLRHAVERAVLLGRGPVVRASDLGPEIAGAAPAPRPVGAADELPLGPLKRALEGPERDLIARALEACGGSRKRTADLLGINRTTLFNKMKKYNLFDRASCSTEPDRGPLPPTEPRQSPVQP